MSVGNCDFCDSDSIVTVNGRAACRDHIHDAMKSIGDVAQIIREALAEEV